MQTELQLAHFSLLSVLYTSRHIETDTERIRSQQGPTVHVKQTPLGMSTTTTDEQRVEAFA